MSRYFDNKGVKHYSEEERDNQNRRYLREEESFRENLESHQIEQTRIAFEQTRILEENARAQQDHNDYMAKLAEKEAEEAKAQRDYSRDLEWLINSDAKGRFEFYQRKFLDNIIPDQVNYIFTKLKLDKYINPDKLSDLNAKLKELVEPYSTYSKFQIEYAELPSRLESDAKWEIDLLKSLSLFFNSGLIIMAFFIFLLIVSGITKSDTAYYDVMITLIILVMPIATCFIANWYCSNRLNGIKKDLALKEYLKKKIVEKRIRI